MMIPFGQWSQPILKTPIPHVASVNIDAKSKSFPNVRICSNDEQAERLAVCLTCEYNSNKTKNGICLKCSRCGGKTVEVKVRMNYEFCPLGKWVALPLK